MCSYAGSGADSFIGVHNVQGSTVHLYILESDAIATMLSPQALKEDKL